MEYVLVSGCLLGQHVRYNGIDKEYDSPELRRWLSEGRVIAVCPEVAAGLPVPRPPAETTGGADGLEVHAGKARVIDGNGQDMSAAFIAGAEKVLREAQRRGVRVAVLKDGSPSCGSNYIYDGSFTSRRVPHAGVTAALLKTVGITVFGETQFAEANALIERLEKHGAV
jgi:uncharacterized protein YbbK (DUF523 family)